MLLRFRLGCRGSDGRSSRWLGALCFLFGLGLDQSPKDALGGLVLSAALQDVSHVQEPANTRFLRLVWPPLALAPGTLVNLNVTSAGSSESNGAVIVMLTAEQFSWLVSWHPSPLNSTDKSISGYIASYWRHPLERHFAANHRITKGPDYFLVSVFNPHMQDLDFTASISFTGPDGEHLPLEYMHVPAACRFAAILFLLLMTATLLLQRRWRGPMSPPLRLLLACLAFKLAALFLQARYYSELNRSGDAPRWLFQTWKLMQKAYEIGEMLLLLLVALGWRLLRPQLSVVELRCTTLALCAASALGFMEALYSIPGIIDISSDGERLVDLALLFYIVQVACYMVTIFATSFNLQVISLNLQDSPVNTGVAGIYYKKQGYQRFRLVFIAVIFRPTCQAWLRVAVPLVLRALGTRWAVQALDEAYVLAVYVSLVIILRPTPPSHGVLDLVKAITGTAGGTHSPPGVASASQPADAGGYVLLSDGEGAFEVVEVVD